MSERSVSRSLEAVRWAALACVVTSAAWAFWFQVLLPSQLPSPADDAAVVAVLEREARASDVVLLYPWWAERARTFVPSRVPVVGYLGSDSDSLDGFERVWVLGQFGLPRSDRAAFERAFLPDRRIVGQPFRLGPYELTLYENGRYRAPVFSSQDPLSVLPRQVYVEQAGGERQVCPWEGNTFRCASGSVSGPEWHEVFYQPVKCLHVRPPGGNARVVLELVPSAWGDILSLEAGMIWEHAPRKGAGQTQVVMAVEAGDGAVIGTLTIEPGEEGLKRMERPLRGWGGGTVRVSVQSERTEDREVCLSVRGVLVPRSRSEAGSDLGTGTGTASDAGVLP